MYDPPPAFIMQAARAEAKASAAAAKAEKIAQQEAEKDAKAAAEAPVRFCSDCYNICCHPLNAP